MTKVHNAVNSFESVRRAMVVGCPCSDQDRTSSCVSLFSFGEICALREARFAAGMQGEQTMRLREIQSAVDHQLKTSERPKIRVGTHLICISAYCTVCGPPYASGKQI